MLFNMVMCSTMALSAFYIAFSALFLTTWGATISRDNLSIVGGAEIPIEYAPYMVALFYEGMFVCGGSIIHEKFILTAAHCVPPNIIPQELGVLVGSDRLNDRGVFVEVEKIMPHERYSTTHTHYNDIALLKLRQEVNDCFWSIHQLPTIIHLSTIIKLPADSRYILEGTMVNVTGWGIVEKNRRTASNELRQTTIPVISNSCCRFLYRSLIEDQMCAGSQGHDACQGDSGGPLTYNGVQIGIVSYGAECGRNPGVYTRVASYLNWIQDKIRDNN